nr:unnamed protein product [Spirometra erinaceieuropaei]
MTSDGLREVLNKSSKEIGSSFKATNTCLISLEKCLNELKENAEGGSFVSQPFYSVMEGLCTQLDYMKNLDQTFISEPLKRVQEATQKRDRGKVSSGEAQISDPGAVLAVAEEVSKQLKRSPQILTDDLVSLLGYSIENSLSSTANSIKSTKRHFESLSERRDHQPENLRYVDQLLKEMETLDMG